MGCNSGHSGSYVWSDSGTVAQCHSGCKMWWDSQVEKWCIVTVIVSREVEQWNSGTNCHSDIEVWWNSGTVAHRFFVVMN